MTPVRELRPMAKSQSMRLLRAEAVCQELRFQMGEMAIAQDFSRLPELLCAWMRHAPTRIKYARPPIKPKRRKGRGKS